MFRTHSLFLFFFISFSVSAQSVDSWLDKMGEAQRQQNYQGTLVIRQSDKLQAIKVKQGVQAGESWQTLESQTGEDQIIFRKNGQVTTIFPSKKLMTVSSAMVGEAKGPLHPALPENRDKLKQLYILKLGAEERVANKVTQIVKMIPRDKHRYGYTFWLDKQSGLLLKCDLINNKGRVLEQLMYSDIELLPTAPSNLFDETKLQAYKKVMLSDGADVHSNKWHAGDLPAGFVITHSVKNTQKNSSYHMVFSDGMASVSVFIEPSEDRQQSLVGGSNMGPVNAYSALINDVYITAIGEVPASTVKMISQSIHLVSHPANHND